MQCTTRDVAAAIALLVMSTGAIAGENGGDSSANPFTVHASIGLHNFTAGEYVYVGSFKLSQLNWKSTGVTVFNGGLDYQIDNLWKVRSKFSVGTGGDGHMVDYDWIYAGGTMTGPNGDDDWTDRSIHPDTRLDHYFAGEIAIDREVYRDEGSAFHIGAGFKYSDIKWTAYGGSYIYSSDAPLFYRDIIGDFTAGEKVISYRQKIPVGFVALSGEHYEGAFSISGGLRGGLSFGIEGIDNHWLRDTDFYDDMGMAPMIGSQIEVNYAVMPSASLYLAGSWERVFHARGDTKQVAPGSTTYYDDSAAATFQSMSVSFGLKGTF